MEENRKLALIVSYYLSKFDRKSLVNLGFSSFTQAFNHIGSILSVPANTIKNMRENFDPLHPNGRVGWYQRELTPSRLDVVENYSHFSEFAMTEIVKEILETYGKTENTLNLYTTIINNDENEENINNGNTKTYTTRGITGNKAEELFIEAFNNGQIEGYSGRLIDKRNDGCGYDFELDSQEHSVVFEVKGLLDETGGINFTDKEWNVASKLRNKYIVVLISNIKENPQFSLFKNPFKTLNAQKRIQKTISINWSVPSKQLF
ncbi:DUF3883 domain-containing protein [Neobacillus sp. NPDC093182]|uniref:DUF3883 domain-containing protein n=1 Tax=Neobacillus sp. NPDC093182 TaxID=3364297 RepID=UPI0037FDF86D